MARTFDDILAQVTAQSDPQRQAVLGQIAALPGQQAADETGLDAKKNAAYDDILSGARQRGLGFSGIPLSEQAKYNATDYAPALANLKSSYANKSGTLQSALAGIGQQNYATANDIFNQDRNFDLQQQQLELQKRQAAAASANPLGGLYNGGNSQPAPQTDPLQQIAYNDVFTRASQSNDAQLKSDYNATLKSAQRGNQKDKYKIELYHQLRPDLFNSNVVPATVLGNGSQLRF